MSNFTAVYDACVLYPAPVRDLLMELAKSSGLFRAKWTNDIHEEWITNLLKNSKDLDRKRLEGTRDKMNENVLDCVVCGYADLIPALKLPDDNDRHVLAAAIVCGADVIVTYNLRDFPEAALKPYGMEAQHPDEFIRHLCDLSMNQVCAAAKTVRARLV